MNKTLFVFIFSIVLFHDVYNEDSACESNNEATDQNTCTPLATSGTTKKCVLDVSGTGCKEDDMTCADKKSGATDDFCKQLPPTGTDSLCTKVGDACQEKTKCNKAKGNNDEECKAFPVEKTGNICKKDTTKNSELCKEEKDESASSQAGNNLALSFAFLIFLFLF